MINDLYGSVNECCLSLLCCSVCTKVNLWAALAQFRPHACPDYNKLSTRIVQFLKMGLSDVSNNILGTAWQKVMSETVQTRWTECVCFLFQLFTDLEGCATPCGEDIQTCPPKS